MEHVVEKWTKGDPCHIEAKILAELCPLFVWKSQLISDKLEYSIVKIPRQCLRYSLI